jgi:hypothetical protein
VGSPWVAAWIAHRALWALLAYGLVVQEPNLRRVAVFVALWFGGVAALSYAPYEPARAMVSSFVAMLDIALVFTIFRGDVRLT